MYDLKKILFSLIFIFIVLSACNNGETDTNYFLSLSGESDHWRLNDYEIIITPEGYKAGNGKLTMKGEEKYTADFFNIGIYSVINGEKNRFHGRSISSSISEGTDIADQTIGTVESEGEVLTEPTEIDEIYAIVTWSDGSREDKEERIILYNKDEEGETFVDLE